jgi:hypothetical protein
LTSATAKRLFFNMPDQSRMLLKHQAVPASITHKKALNPTAKTSDRKKRRRYWGTQ